MAYTAPTSAQVTTIAKYLGFGKKAVTTANAKAATALETMKCARYLGTSKKQYDKALAKAAYVFT